MSRVALALVLAVALLTPPLAAEAQEKGKVYRVGFLASPSSVFNLATYIPGRLGFLGDYQEGTDIVFHRRTAVTPEDRLDQLARELVEVAADVIVTDGTTATQAAKHATQTTPIVMLVGGDPVRAGLVASLGRPGGNVTGMTTLSPDLSRKRLEILKETVPSLTCVTVPLEPEQSRQGRRTRRDAGCSSGTRHQHPVARHDDGRRGDVEDHSQRALWRTPPVG